MRKTLLLGPVLLLACSTSQIDPVMVRFEEMEEDLREITQEDGAVSALHFLQERVTAEPALADVCHGLSHIAGEAAFERYGIEQALLFEEDVCGSGYVHGVVESYLAEIDDLEAVLLSLCPADAAKCFHGIGHGLMDRSKNDIPGSLALCSRFPERFQKVQCAEGVFMENFDADQKSHSSLFLKKDDPFFPCRGQETMYEGVCAFYAPRYYLRLHPQAYDDALLWCDTLPGTSPDACVKGVGAVATKQHINEPLFVESLCNHVEGERQPYCIEGLASYYIVHYASSSKGREMCGSLQDTNTAHCLKIAAESAKVYPE